MGIPFYFSYIVKNHPFIIQKYIKEKIEINNLFLDCNSIVYDVVNTMKYEEITETLHNHIINHVIHKIENYINIISPTNVIYIAFDGVAPVAKLQQQRDRRYKSWYQSEMSKNIFNKTVRVDAFNTTAITPGTAFMNELNTKIRTHFERIHSKNNIIFSGSDEPGEGEHKLFHYIRTSENIKKDSCNVVYGLDADLIMLSINHLPEHPHIYLFRETPEFIKSLDSTLEPNASYFLDIPELAKMIALEMETETIETNNGRMYDYIFICFFLGNDFMPHFPSINIRTGGVNKMLNAYKETIGSTQETLVTNEGQKIIWKNLRKLVQHLVQQEEPYLLEEYKYRDRREKTFYPEIKPEEIFKKFENIPTIDRGLEKYINPRKSGWQSRYYHTLFDWDPSMTNTSVVADERKRELCTNYLEGLEWTMKYYSNGCADWRWNYRYNYPPLLEDLIHFIPLLDTEFISNKKNNTPVSTLFQLSYVLPKTSLHLLPKEIENKLLQDHGEWYNNNCEFVWAFCKYFWESHVVLDEIDVVALDSIVNAYEEKQLL
jgi:5'-3' exoribonuclease 1